MLAVPGLRRYRLISRNNSTAVGLRANLNSVVAPPELHSRLGVQYTLQ